MWTTYKEMYENIDNEKKLIQKSLEMVRFANEYGIKGLKDKSRRPHHSPKRIDIKDIIKIKECVDYAKEKKKYITVNNVRRKTKITKYSDETINRYINESCNGKKNKKHIQPKKDVSWKQKIKPFMYWEIDIKYLTDIDNLKPYFKKNNDRSLPKYQITARNISTGFPVVAYCDDRCSSLLKNF